MGEVKINVTADYAIQGGTGTNPEDLKPPGSVSLNRYVMEVYSDEAHSVAANVFKDGTNRAVGTAGSFIAFMDRSKVYYCLFWADTDAKDIYDIASLKAVTLKSGITNPEEAFHGKQTVEGKQTICNVTLKRAVANVIIQETGILPAGKLFISFNQKNVFDVSTSSTTGPASGRTEDIDVTGFFGTEEKPVRVNAEDILILAPAVSSESADFVFRYKEYEIVISAEIQANRITNIKSHYTTIIFKTEAAAGDYYYSDNTVSSGLYYGKKCIGIVFWVDPNDRSRGKIVSLDERGKGRHPDYCPPWISRHPAPAGYRWNVPTKLEMKYLYCAYNGAEPQEYADYTDDAIPADKAARDLFNKILYGDAIIGLPIIGTKLDDRYWISSFGLGGAWQWHINFSNGLVSDYPLDDYYWYIFYPKVRVVSDFKISDKE